MSNPKRLTILLLGSIALFSVTLGLWKCGDWLYNHKAREFSRSVREGMSKDQVLVVVGQASEHLATSEVLPQWGGYPAEAVQGETWVYYFGPGNIHRFSVTFGHGVVVKVVHHLT
jgi:hypothetical protein